MTSCITYISNRPINFNAKTQISALRSSNERLEKQLKAARQKDPERYAPIIIRYQEDILNNNARIRQLESKAESADGGPKRFKEIPDSIFPKSEQIKRKTSKSTYHAKARLDPFQYTKELDELRRNQSNIITKHLSSIPFDITKSLLPNYSKITTNRPSYIDQLLQNSLDDIHKKSIIRNQANHSKEANLFDDKTFPYIDKSVSLYSERFYEKTKSLEKKRPSKKPVQNQEKLAKLRQIKKLLEKKTGLTIDVDTFANGTPLHLLGSPKIINAILNSVKSIQVSKNYLKGIVFKTLPEGIAAQYNEKLKKIEINSDVNLSFFVNSGLHHEFAHAWIAEHIGISKDILQLYTVKQAHVLTEAFEEVAVDMLAYSVVVNKAAYAQEVRKKYRIESRSDAKEFVEDCLSKDNNGYRRIDIIAAALSVFSVIDRKLYKILKSTIDEALMHKSTRSTIAKLEFIFKSIDLNNKNSCLSNSFVAAQAISNEWDL